MANKKGLKGALVSSIVAVALSCTTFVGTTFAWFTDSVTSTGNVIQTGTLDVEMYWAEGQKEVPTVDTGWKDASKGAIFDYANWEPGYVQARHIKVANEGTLAFKYKLLVVPNGTVSALADVIDVYYIENATTKITRADLATKTPVGTLRDMINDPDGAAYGVLGADSEQTVTIALKMREEAGNEYQKLSIGSNFSIQLLATQYTAEEDSFDDQYDKDATYTSTYVAIPETGPAVDVTLQATENSEIEVTLPADTMETLPAEVKSIALSYTEAVLDSASSTITFDSIEIVDQNGKVVDLEALNNNEDITVTLNVGDAFIVGSFVDIYHDGVLIADDVQVDAEKNVTYTTKHFCEVEIALEMLETTEQVSTAIANAQAGDVVSIAEGNYTLKSLTGKENITIAGNVNGGTKVASVNHFNFGKNTVIKNITFKTDKANSVRYATTAGNVVFENCVFEGKQYGMHIDNANGGTVTFNNCEFRGRNAFAASGEYEFNNCEFKYTYSNYNTLNVHSKAVLNNCKWDSKLELSIADGAKAIVDGTELTQRTVFISDARALESFQFAVNGGDSYAGVVVMLGADIDMKEGYYAQWYPIGQTGATQFKGTFDGHGHTIKNLNINSSKQTGEHYSSGLFGWLNNAIVRNLTIENATVTGNHNVGVIAGYMETTGCTISNCHVINATVIANHANDDACGDKVGVIVGHAGNAGVKVENCSATNCTVTAGRDAGQIVGAALQVNVIGCVATNVVVSAKGDCTGANINNAIIGRIL